MPRCCARFRNRGCEKWLLNLGAAHGDHLSFGVVDNGKCLELTSPQGASPGDLGN